MPPKKSNYRSKPRRRRAPRRARANVSGGLVVAKQSTLVPDRMILKMSYKDNISLNYTSGELVYHDMRLNSIYDPDVAITTGHQPLGYDQWQVFYNKYRVFKAQVKITIVNEGETSLRAAFVPYNSQAYPQTDDSFFEQPHAVSRVVAPISGMNRTTIVKTIHCPRLMGKSSDQYRSSELTSALFGSNPQEQVWGRIGVSQLDGDEGATAYALFEVIYHVELYDRTAQTISAPQYKKDNPDWKL